MRTTTFRLVLVMVFTLPWENVLELPGIGRVSRLIGLVVAVTWLIAIARTGHAREPRAVHIFAFLFVLWNACSMFWTVDGPATQGRMITYAQLFVLILVIWDTTTTLHAVRQLLLAYLAGCYVAIASLLYGYVFQMESVQMYGRMTVSGFHPNDVGMILAFGVPFAAYFIAAPGRERLRWARSTCAAAYLPLAGLAVLLTGSRSALGGMLPGLVYLGYVLARRRPRVAVGVLGTLASLVFLAIPLLPTRVLSRLGGTAAAVQDGDLNHREEVWAEAIRLFFDHPLTGTGSGAFRAAAVSVGRVGHNFVFALLAEVGAVGLVLFLATLVSALWPLRRLTPVLRGMWLALSAAWLFGAMLQNLEYRKQTWLFLGLMAACGYLRDHSSDSHPHQADARSSGSAP